jgi:hypothetical protein
VPDSIGQSHSDSFPEYDFLAGSSYEYEFLKRTRTAPPMSIAEHDQFRSVVTQEVNRWYSHAQRAERLLPTGWEVIWKVGVPEGEPFRAHLISPDQRRETFHGTSHAGVFDAIAIRIIELRTQGTMR